MRKEIVLQMADGNEKSIPFCANGATALRFRMVFGKELMESIVSVATRVGIENIAALTKNAGEAQELVLEEMSPDQLKVVFAIVGSGEMNTVSQLAYIMNAAAEQKDMRSLNVEGWLDWMEQFETMEFLTHAVDIIMIYMNNRATTSTPKKKEDRLIER